MQGLLRLGVYAVLLVVSLTIFASFPESTERVGLQILLFSGIALYLFTLIRREWPLWRRAWPEVLYLLAALYFAAASAMRLLDLA